MKRSIFPLETENARLKARVAELEAKVAELEGDSWNDSGCSIDDYDWYDSGC